jgi:dTMP kinase
MTRGLLIAFEGIDCSGKSTQAKLLNEKLENSVLMSFPNKDTSLGKYIQKIIKQEVEYPSSQQAVHMLFTANRWENYNRIFNYLIKKSCGGKALVVV